MRRRTLLALALTLPVAATAVQPDEQLKDPALEARARKLSAELRCLVCQNESIDDSNAPLARDLRLLVRERITAGDADGDIRAFLVKRYGEFVLLRPPLSWRTALLWIGPFAALGVAAVLLLRRVETPPVPAAPPLSDQEKADLERRLQNRP
ncbi:MAG: cytochrome c-type biogenesis protein [Beijerinckiaceae bacterium]